MKQDEIKEAMSKLYSGENVAGKLRQPKKRDWLDYVLIIGIVLGCLSWIGFWLLIVYLI